MSTKRNVINDAFYIVIAVIAICALIKFWSWLSKYLTSSDTHNGYPIVDSTTNQASRPNANNTQITSQSLLQQPKSMPQYPVLAATGNSPISRTVPNQQQQQQSTPLIPSYEQTSMPYTTQNDQLSPPPPSFEEAMKNLPK